MSKMKHAVSLIVLVVTILVLAILAAAVIISLSNANIMSQASKTVFKSDMANFKEAYEMYVISELADDVNFDRSTLNVTYASDEFEDIFGANVSDKYKEGLQVVNGELVYVTEDETEKEILEDLGIASSTTETPSTPVEPETPVTPETPSDVIGTETETVNGETRSKYIGYYADVDGDGSVDGVIFADLAYTVKDKQWYNSNGAFSYEAETDELKDYVVSQESYTAKSGETELAFGTKPVLKAVGSGADRFYVMALSDITTSDNITFYWYYSLYGSADTNKTSLTFGSGKQNTVTMISEWNNDTDGQNTRDMWGVIKQKVYGLKSATDDITGKTKADVKWFVPSRAEWGAFGYALSLTSSNYGSFGLKNFYWSSSLGNTDIAWGAYFSNGYMYGSNISSSNYVRLAATF